MTKAAAAAVRKKNDTTAPSEPSYGVTAVVIGLVAIGSVGLFGLSGEDQEQEILGSFASGAANVRIKVTQNTGRSLVARKHIKQNMIIYSFQDATKTINSNSAARLHPTLESEVVAALKPLKERSCPLASQVLTSIMLADEKRKGIASNYYGMISLMPANVSTIGYYWTQEEIDCTVSKSSVQRDTLSAFKQAIDTLYVTSAFIKSRAVSIEKQDLEWAFIMVKTRSFDFTYAGSTVCTMMPAFDLVNHNPLYGTYPFVIEKTMNGYKSAQVYTIATQNYHPGDEILASYGSLSVQETASKYGFVDPNSVFVDVTRINPFFYEFAEGHDAGDSFKDHCGGQPSLFFGDHGTKKLEISAMLPPTYGIKDGKPIKSGILYKPGRPIDRTLQCVQVYLQNRSSVAVGSFLAQQLEIAAKDHRELASSPFCQKSTGSFPLIRESNLVAARLIDNARAAALRGARGKAYVPSKLVESNDWQYI